MQLLKYQGAVFLGAAPGSTASWQGLEWSVTEQGHLVTNVEADQHELARDLVMDCGVVEVVPEGEESILAPLIAAARVDAEAAAAAAEAAQQEG